MDPLGLKAAQRRRDAEVDAAQSGAVQQEKAQPPAEVDFTKPGPPVAPDVKAKRASRLAELLKARDADKNAYVDAWKDDRQ